MTLVFQNMKILNFLRKTFAALKVRQHCTELKMDLKAENTKIYNVKVHNIKIL